MWTNSLQFNIYNSNNSSRLLHVEAEKRTWSFLDYVISTIWRLHKLKICLGPAHICLNSLRFCNLMDTKFDVIGSSPSPFKIFLYQNFWCQDVSSKKSLQFWSPSVSKVCRSIFITWKVHQCRFNCKFQSLFSNGL